MAQLGIEIGALCVLTTQQTFHAFSFPSYEPRQFYVPLERPSRMSLRPSEMLSSAMRGLRQATLDLPATNAQQNSRKPSLPLANGIIKRASSGGEGDNSLVFPVPVTSGRRLTRFSSFLLHRPSMDTNPNESSTTDLIHHQESLLSMGEYADHRLVLIELLCCCACCRNASAGQSVGGQVGGSGCDAGVVEGTSSQQRGVGDYANLIENHRLARLVTLLAVFAILGLVLTYIIKSIVEQTDQQQDGG